MDMDVMSVRLPWNVCGRTRRDGGSMADSRQGGDDVDDDGHKCMPSAQRRQHGVAAAHS
jgi:hypothetical protein